MSKVYLLDCTLRDGGYVNNWNFGEKEIEIIRERLENSGVNIIELGFMRNEPSNLNRTVFSSIKNADKIIGKKKSDIIYSVMIEAFNPYPLNKLDAADFTQTDLIRVCIWKRLIGEHMEYAKAVADKGYKISIQPSRVEQYSEIEFIDMLKHSNELHPFSVYVVDTWGTQSSAQIVKYLELADRYLDNGIKIGYHGHNNKMQALSCAQAALDSGLSHDLCIDSSIMGMGRGAGNLHTEIIMDYLNESKDAEYRVTEIVEAYGQCIKQFYDTIPWGYSIYYYLSAMFGCNPNIATYFKKADYDERLFRRFLDTLTEPEKVVFNGKDIEQRIEQIKQGDIK